MNKKPTKSQIQKYDAKYALIPLIENGNFNWVLNKKGNIDYKLTRNSLKNLPIMAKYTDITDSPNKTTTFIDDVSRELKHRHLIKMERENPILVLYRNFVFDTWYDSVHTFNFELCRMYKDSNKQRIDYGYVQNLLTNVSILPVQSEPWFNNPQIFDKIMMISKNDYPAYPFDVYHQERAIENNIGMDFFTLDPESASRLYSQCFRYDTYYITQLELKEIYRDFKNSPNNSKSDLDLKKDAIELLLNKLGLSQIYYPDLEKCFDDAQERYDKFYEHLEKEKWKIVLDIDGNSIFKEIFDSYNELYEDDEELFSNFSDDLLDHVIEPTAQNICDVKFS